MDKYLFLDSGIFDGYRLRNSKLSINSIIKDEANNPLFREDYFSEPSRPWEVRYDNSYPNVIYDKDNDIYRCYYTLFTYDTDSQSVSLEERKNRQYRPNSGRVTSCCYAESKDGVKWEKPNLGLVEFDGNKDNNIIFRHAHGTSVFLDELETNPKKRYKLMTKVDYSRDRNYMATAFSEDGIHFTEFHEWPRYNPAGDTHNFVFRDHKTDKFILITRIWRNSLRIVAMCESTDFINWSEPIEITRGNGFGNQIYSMPVFQYGGLYMGLASIYHEGDRDAEDFDLVDLELKFSSDLMGWESIGSGNHFIPRGEGEYGEGEFDCGCVYSTAPLEIDGKLWFYYMGGNGQHTNYRETSFARGYVEKDKFAFYETKNKEKEAVLQTRQMNVYGDNLRILAEIEDEGSLSVAFVVGDGKAIEGFEHENCIITEDKDGWYDISYKDKKITAVENQSIKMEIKFKDSKLFALEGEIAVNRYRY